VPGLFGSSVKTEFEIKKSGSLVLTGKLLEFHGYKQGQRFKLEFAEKQITLNMI